MIIKKKWSSKTYKKAANKHYQTCEQLINYFESIREDAKPHIVSNIFYLSGYVLECILKSYLLELEHCTNELTMEQLTIRGLKTHNVKELWDKIDHGIDKKSFNWTDISTKWEVYVRYDNSVITFQEVKQHFEETIKPIYVKIREQY